MEIAPRVVWEQFQLMFNQIIHAFIVAKKRAKKLLIVMGKYNLKRGLFAQNRQNFLVVFDLIGWNSWSLINQTFWIKPNAVNSCIITTLNISS